MNRGWFSLTILGLLILGPHGPAEEPGETHITAGVKDADGFLVHTITCPYQEKPTILRVLLPERLEKDKRYPVLYLLPVEAADGRRYGDGMLEAKKLDLPNKFGVICVMPAFTHLPWYADHPTDKGIRQESYLLKTVLPYVNETYPVIAKPEGRLLLGFSKSGWGAFSLLLRQPDVFGKAAAWDAPLMMDKPGLYGSGDIFGGDDNFQKYRVTRLLESKADPLGDVSRLAVLGYGNFRKEHQAVHDLMERFKICHEYRDGPERKHDWHSGWVIEAARFLVGAKDEK